MILVVPATRGARLFTDEEIMTVLSCTEGKVFLRPEVGLHAMFYIIMCREKRCKFLILSTLDASYAETTSNLIEPHRTSSNLLKTHIIRIVDNPILPLLSLPWSLFGNMPGASPVEAIQYVDGDGGHIVTQFFPGLLRHLREQGVCPSIIMIES